MRTAHPPNPCCNPCTSRGYRPSGFGTRSIPAKAPKACQTRDLAHRLLLAPMQSPCFSRHRHGAHLVGFLLVKKPQEGWGAPVSFGSASTEQALRAHQRHLPGWVRGLPGAGSTGKGGERGLNRRRTIGGSRKQRLDFSFPNPGSEYGFQHGAASDSRVEHSSQLHRAPDHEPRQTAASGWRTGGSGRPLRTCR